MDTSTPLFPESVPEIDADLMSFFLRSRWSVKKGINLSTPMDVQAGCTVSGSLTLGPRWGLRLDPDLFLEAPPVVHPTL